MESSFERATGDLENNDASPLAVSLLGMVEAWSSSSVAAAQLRFGKEALDAGSEPCCRPNYCLHGAVRGVGLVAAGCGCLKGP